MKKKASLTKYIFWGILGGVLIICILQSGMKFYTAYSAIVRQTRDALLYSNLEYSTMTREWLNKFSGLLESFAAETGERALYTDRDEMEKYLKKRLVPYSDVLSVYMSTVENVMIDSTNWRPDESYIAQEREWYIKAKDTNETVYIDPYVDAQTGQMVLSISKKIVTNGEFQGVMAMDIVTDVLSGFIRESVTQDDQYAFLTDQNGNILIHPDEALTAKNGEFTSLESLSGDYNKILDAIHTGDTSTNIRIKNYKNREEFMTAAVIPETGWRMISAYPSRYEKQAVVREIFSTMMILAGSISALILLILLFSRKYLTPFKQVTEVVKRVANGELSAKTQHIERNSAEIEELLCAIEGMMNQNSGYIQEIGGVLGRLSKGDLTVSVKGTYVGDYAGIKTSLQEIIRSYNATLRKIQLTAEEVFEGSLIISGSVDQLSQDSDSQVKKMDELTETISQMKTQLNKNAENAENANQVAQNAGKILTEGDMQMKELLNSFAEMSTASSQIRTVIKSINDIAYKTNILALNAAVEAARAGEAGKGFTVVADEVRNLAAKSAEAANETAVLIERSVEAVENGVEIAGKTSKIIQKTINGAKESSVLTEQVATGSSMQVERMQRIKEEIYMVSSLAEGSASSAQKNAEASSGLFSQAETLKELVSAFII
ncbi:MAG: methyl-accepting chemotaxis protein [Acetivibrio sp.]